MAELIGVECKVAEAIELTKTLQDLIASTCKKRDQVIADNIVDHKRYFERKPNEKGCAKWK